MIQEVKCLKRVKTWGHNFEFRYSHLKELIRVKFLCKILCSLVYFVIIFQAFIFIVIVIVAQPSRFYIETYMPAENQVWMTLA